MIILFTMLLCEIILVTYTIKNGKEVSKWHKNRLITRTSQIVIYWLCMFLPGNKFDLRFKLLFWVLVLLWIYSFILWFINRNNTTRTKSAAGLIIKAILSIFLYCFALIPAFLFSGYEGLETTGNYEVAQTKVILIDETRIEEMEKDGSYREVPIYIYYPNTNIDEHRNEFPLVVFSHGAFGYYQSNSSSYLELASKGYVVVSLDHPYHSFFTKDSSGKLITVNSNFMREVMYVNEINTPENDIFDTSSKWIKIRTSDINFVINQLKEGNIDSGTWVYNNKEKDKIINAINLADCDTIGLYGHSLGGAACVSVGRQRDDINAVIDLDGTMLGEQIAFENGKYRFNEEAYPVPILAINTESHYLSALEYGDLYVNNRVIENAVDGKTTYFKNAGHMNFTDLPLFSPALSSLLGIGSIDSEKCIRQTNAIIDMYFDHYLKNEGEVVLQEYYE